MMGYVNFDSNRSEGALVKGWKHSLMQSIGNLQTEASVSYLAKKADALLAKEQRDLGNVDYVGIFKDPDLDDQDPGG